MVRWVGVPVKVEVESGFWAAIPGVERPSGAPKLPPLGEAPPPVPAPPPEKDRVLSAPNAIPPMNFQLTPTRTMLLREADLEIVAAQNQTANAFFIGVLVMEELGADKQIIGRGILETAAGTAQPVAWPPSSS